MRSKNKLIVHWGEPIGGGAVRAKCGKVPYTKDAREVTLVGRKITCRQCLKMWRES